MDTVGYILIKAPHYHLLQDLKHIRCLNKILLLRWDAFLVEACLFTPSPKTELRGQSASAVVIVLYAEGLVTLSHF